MSTDTDQQHAALEHALWGVDVDPELVLQRLTDLGWTVTPGEELQAAIDRHPAGNDLPDLEADGYAWPAESESILRDAQTAIYGDRQTDYGHPRENMTRTAIVWTGLLQHLLTDGAYIDAADVARCMVGVKLARDVNAPKRDNRVDGAGYFAILDRLQTGK